MITAWAVAVPADGPMPRKDVPPDVPPKALAVAVTAALLVVVTFTTALPLPPTPPTLSPAAPEPA